MERNITEIWKGVVGAEGTYQVSNLGRVRSIDRIVNSRFSTRRANGKILVNFISRFGYPCVSLFGNTKANIAKWKSQS